MSEFTVPDDNALLELVTGKLSLSDIPIVFLLAAESAGKQRERERRTSSIRRTGGETVFAQRDGFDNTVAARILPETRS